jgi:methionyl-tRNA formyltransferase
LSAPPASQEAVRSADPAAPAAGPGANSSAGLPPLRVVLCTCAGLYAARVLAGLLASPRLRVVGIVCSTRVLAARYGFARGALEQIRRSGLRYASYLWLATTGADWALRARGPGAGGVRPQALARQAAARAIPVLDTRDVNAAPGREFLEGCGADLLVSAFFNQRLGEAVLALPPLGAVNLHPALLPDFKGVDPVFFAQLRRAPRLGVTLHRMTPAFDEGAILAQAAVPVGADASVAAATAALFAGGAQLLVEHLEPIARGAPGAAQAGPGSYDSWPSAAQVRRFRAQGGVLIRLSDLFG